MERVMSLERSQSQQEVVENPAIGIVATESNSDVIARTILRAREHAQQVFVAHDGDTDLEAVQFAEQLDANIVRPHEPGIGSDEFRAELAAGARAHSHPGIILAPANGERVDFERSLEKLDEDTFAVDATLESSYDSDDGVSSTLVAIPAYNEGKAIADVVTTAKQYATEVVVVDDASSDGTAERAREAGATIIQHADNRGYGGALKTSFNAAERRNASHLVILDGDGQHDGHDIPKLVETQQETGAEVVIGSRFAEGSETEIPLYRRFGLWVVNQLTNLSMGVVRPRSRVADTQSGFRAYNRDAINSLAADETVGDHMSASTDILYHAHNHNYEIEEVGTTISYDVEDASTHNPISHGLSLVGNILKTIEHERPVTVLGIPGFISSFVGLGFGYATFSNYINTGIFPLGLAVTASFFTLVGIFACFTAIILHSLNTHL
ncbi:Glycosyl transferase family 2 [Halogranum rubrum]|uniref:Glycosyl transferase family 2 n=1 Tax=Halogranum rubrum TaxID=553466 RepID=A0A1I4BBA9_9EURY|nr:glycosyltransferase family 2 protein [Halogranum rubrum]SFK65339.1 Glycosyl transferase family 2 [Halogranum rubrum]